MTRFQLLGFYKMLARLLNAGNYGFAGTLFDVWVANEYGTLVTGGLQNMDPWHACDYWVARQVRHAFRLWVAG
jgi:hypothetical protein